MTILSHESNGQNSLDSFSKFLTIMIEFPDMEKERMISLSVSWHVATLNYYSNCGSFKGKNTISTPHKYGHIVSVICLLSLSVSVCLYANCDLFAFQTADSGLYRDVWLKIKEYPDNLVSDPLQGALKAQKQNFIYITEVQCRIWSVWLFHFHHMQILFLHITCKSYLYTSVIYQFIVYANCRQHSQQLLKRFTVIWQ